jgi:hypothetical protein
VGGRIYEMKRKLIRGDPLRVPQKAGDFLTTRKRLVFRGLCSVKSAAYEENEHGTRQKVASEST